MGRISRVPPPGALTTDEIHLMVEKAKKFKVTFKVYQVTHANNWTNYSQVYTLWATHKTKVCEPGWWRDLTWYDSYLSNGCKCGHNQKDAYLFTNYWLAHAYCNRTKTERKRHGLDQAA